METKATLIECPNEMDWVEVRRRCLVTAGKDFDEKVPSMEWRRKLLEARHSPIRYIRFSFYIECPYWVSVHLCRHIHSQPYVRSQRNDRQSDYDREKAPQEQPVCMIWDMNAEELMNVANKRLCRLASAQTREVVKKMCELVIEKMPEFKAVLVPVCEYNGVCHEMFPCGGKKND